jgi:hypothetical protein
MESYIVRIYRTEKDNPSGLVGVVEEVGQRGRAAFTNLDEMWEILNPAGKEERRSGGRKKARAKRRKKPMDEVRCLNPRLDRKKGG